MRCLSVTRVVAGCAGVLLMTGCQGPISRTVGMSVAGRPIKCRTLGDGDDVVLLMATIHGDEPVGTPLLRDLEKHLLDNRRLLEGRTVVIMPVANPDGYEPPHSRGPLCPAGLSTTDCSETCSRPAREKV